MIAALLCCVLFGPEVPQRPLYLGVSGGPQSRNLRVDVSRDLWINANFKPVFVEQCVMEPVWRTGRFGVWTKWPELTDAPNGPFCTPGMSIIALRPALIKHIREMNAGEHPEEESNYWYWWYGTHHDMWRDRPTPVGGW